MRFNPFTRHLRDRLFFYEVGGLLEFGVGGIGKNELEGRLSIKKDVQCGVEIGRHIK